MPAPQNLRNNILLLGVTLILGLAVIEIALRMAQFSFPLFTRADAELGFSLQPGACGWQTSEGRARVCINARGMRDVERPVSPATPTFRIALLGDSYAEARQVALTASFPKVLERELAACPAFGGRQVEVWNFGVSGYGTAQQLLQLRSRVWDTNPDLVLLAFTTGNDVRNNSRALEGAAPKPYFTVESGALVLDTRFQADTAFQKQLARTAVVKRWLYVHSRLLQVLRRAQVAWQQRAAPAPDSGTEIGLDLEVYREPQTADWGEAWTVTEALLAALAEGVQSHRRHLVLVSLANAAQVDPNPAERSAFVAEHGLSTLFYPEQRLSAFSEREQIPYLPLAPALQAIAERDSVFLHGFPNTQLGTGHWNAEGHQRAGAVMADWLCDLAAASSW